MKLLAVQIALVDVVRRDQRQRFVSADLGDRCLLSWPILQSNSKSRWVSATAVATECKNNRVIYGSDKLPIEAECQSSLRSNRASAGPETLQSIGEI
jgi:hypothetical protein